MTNTRFMTPDTLPENGRVIIYGSGAAALTVLERIRGERPDVTVPCLLDSFNEGEAGGLRVVKKADLATLDGTYDLILIASAWWRDIAQGLADDGIETFGVASPVLWHKYMFSDADLLAAKGKIDGVMSLLATDEDREIYRFLIEARRENSPLVNTDAVQPEIVDFLQVRNSLFGHLTDQYLDFVVREPVRTMLHAGVFDGTDCLRFLKIFPNLQALHGFEPQGKVHIAPETLATINNSGRVHIHEKGLWSSSRTIPLTGSGSYTTLTPDAAHDQITGSIETVSIDEFTAAHGMEKVDYICLDVEGAEARTLRGAARTIAASRPQLAVCIYHLKEDIYTLPLLMDEMLDDYVYHIGHYCNFMNETVLYALPRELVE